MHLPSLHNPLSVRLRPALARPRAGTLTIDDEVHLTRPAAEEEDPALAKLRTTLDHRIGELQLPQLLREVDARVRCSWIMLGREPRSETKLLMVHAGILAQGTSCTGGAEKLMVLNAAGTAIKSTTYPAVSTAFAK